MKINFKSSLLLMGAILPALMLQAAPVSPETAMAEAGNFLNSGASSKARGIDPTRRLTLAYTSSSDKDPQNYFYIFNTGSGADDSGFVIVSADDRLPAVLGYSDNGAFDYDRIPENMKWWLDGYAGEISAALPHLAEDGGAARKAKVMKKAQHREPIAPMLSTKWDQGKPFNNQCPLDRNNLRSATGCVATAVSQIMNFHQWPLRPEGSNAGVTFTGTTYAWRLMIDEYVDGKYSSAEANAVATLMRQVGAAVNMMYSSYASGAYDYDVQLALTKYFDYSKGITFHWKDYTPQREWVNIVYDELAQGRPIYYSGSSSQGGHAFVCDGYSENDYFHFNWGWGGYEDGYFLLSALNPASGGAGSYEGGYNFNQTILTGIMPAKENPDAKTQVAMLTTGGFFYDQDSQRFVVQNGHNGENFFYNPLGFTQRLDVALKLVKDDGTESIIKCDSNVELAPFYGSPYLKAAFGIMGDGTYKITPIVANAGSNDWQPVLIPLGQQNYVQLIVKNGQKTFVNAGPDSDFLPKLIVGTPQFPSTIYAGTTIPVRIPLLNVGDGDFNSQIGLSLFDAENEFGDIVSYQDNAAVAGKSFTNLDIAFSETVSPGTYKVSMMDIDNNTYIDNLRIQVKDGKFPPIEGEIQISDIYPSFYETGSSSPVYFSINNDAHEETTVRFNLEIVDPLTLERTEVVGKTYNVSVPARYSTRISVTPFDFGLAPGEYLWRISDIDGTPLSLPTPLIVTSAETTSGDLTYVITDEARHEAILTAPIADAYSGNIEVPETIDGYKILALRNDAFTFATAKDVTLPASITTIPAGAFYCDSDLRNLTLQANELVSTGNEAFNYDLTSGICWLNAPDDLANTYRYDSKSTFRGFRQSSWLLTLSDGAEIASGFPEINMLGDANEYFVNPETPHTITFSAPAGKNIKVLVIKEGEWIFYETIASGTSVELPALGIECCGEIRAYATEDPVAVDTIYDAEESMLDVFSIDGKVILSNSSAAQRAALPAGIYILSDGTKFIVK